MDDDLFVSVFEHVLGGSVNRVVYLAQLAVVCVGHVELGLVGGDVQLALESRLVPVALDVAGGGLADEEVGPAVRGVLPVVDVEEGQEGPACDRWVG